MRGLLLLSVLATGLVCGCGNNSSQGGSAEDQPPVTGRSGDTGGNGKVYDRGGTGQKPGTGRVDNGGGLTAPEGPVVPTATNDKPKP